MRPLAPLLLSLTSYLIPPTVADPPHNTPLNGLDRDASPFLPPTVPLDKESGSRIEPKEHDFTLRHILHRGTHRYPNLFRQFDVPPKAQVFITDDETSYRQHVPRLRAKSNSLRIQRLADREPARVNSIIDEGRLAGQAVSLPPSAWTIDEVPGPNVTDKETVLSFARIAANAYVVEPGQGDWEEVGGGFNYTEDFGWELDGLRGHIFADTQNQTVVIGLKGTSPAVFDGADTTTNDKINDNLFFGCCCGQGGQYLWKQVCDCKTTAYTCNNTCLVQALRAKNRYYYAAQDLYHNVTALYPNADIWLAGHSLGGAVSSLLGLTFGLPVLTYEAPAEAMAAARLGLPVPPGYNLGFHQTREMTGGYHFGQTADPIFMGSCNGAYSTCTLAGYSMESTCHTGQVCAYDTVNDNGWRVGIGNHRIKSVIHDVIMKYDQPPKCEPYPDCTDCFNWEYFESNSSSSTTTSSSSTSTTKTRTATCKTPGWWGCLDETTTTTTESKTTTSSSTSTCKTPGWFGCKDPVITTTTSDDEVSATPAPVPTVTTTSTVVATSGRWSDPTSISTATSPFKSSAAPSTSTTCHSKEWFGFICVDPSPTNTVTKTTTTTTTALPASTCMHRSWLGRCKEWSRPFDQHILDGWKEDMR